MTDVIHAEGNEDRKVFELSGRPALALGCKTKPAICEMADRKVEKGVTEVVCWSRKSEKCCFEANDMTWRKIESEGDSEPCFRHLWSTESSAGRFVWAQDLCAFSK